MNTTTLPTIEINAAAAGEPKAFALLKPRKGTRPNTQAVRLDLASQAIEFAKASGVHPDHVGKLANIFVGDRALCAPMSPRLHIAHINGVCMENEILCNEVSGSLNVPLAGEKEDTTIVLQENGDQNLFLIAVERMGGASSDGSDDRSRFLSYSLVCPETTGDMPLVIGMNAVNDGQRITLKWSRRLYLKEIVNPVTRESDWENRLASLEGLQNMEGVCFHVAKASEFPIMETPINATAPRARGNRNANRGNNNGNSGESYAEAAVAGSDAWAG